MLSALQYLHNHQVLHLDLKPDNILLTHINNDVKLIDLGFCYTDTFADTQGHTNAFAAPEQKTGGAVDVRTDLYAFGKILELLPDHSLYNRVIARCTAQNPSDRYQSIDEILYDINHRRRYFRYVAAFVAIGAVLAIGIALLTHQQNVTPERKETFKDSNHVTQRDSVVKEKSLDSVIQNVPALLPQSPKTTGKAWADASTEFHDQIIEIENRLAKKYPNIPESTIRQDCETRFQSLVTSVFNQMRTNAQQ